MTTFLLVFLALVFTVLQIATVSYKVIEINPFKLTAFGKLILIVGVILSSISYYNQNKTEKQTDEIQKKVDGTEAKVNNIEKNVKELSTDLSKVDQKTDSTQLISLQGLSQGLTLKNTIDSLKTNIENLKKQGIKESVERKKEVSRLNNLIDTLSKRLDTQNNIVTISEISNLQIADIKLQKDKNDSTYKIIQFNVTNSGRSAKVIHGEHVLIKVNYVGEITQIIDKAEPLLLNKIISNSLKDQNNICISRSVKKSDLKGDFLIAIYCKIVYQDEYTKNKITYEEVFHADCKSDNLNFGNNPEVQKIVLRNMRAKGMLTSSN